MSSITILPLLSKCHHILSATDIRLKILMIFMSRITMHGSKVEDYIILCRSKWQVLDRLADIIRYDTVEVSPDHAISETDDGDRSNTLVEIAVMCWYQLHRYAWYRYCAIVILFGKIIWHSNTSHIIHKFRI